MMPRLDGVIYSARKVMPLRRFAITWSSNTSSSIDSTLPDKSTLVANLLDSTTECVERSASTAIHHENFFGQDHARHGRTISIVAKLQLEAVNMATAAEKLRVGDSTTGKVSCS
jgi:hypothetical protein